MEANSSIQPTLKKRRISLQFLEGGVAMHHYLEFFCKEDLFHLSLSFIGLITYIGMNLALSILHVIFHYYSICLFAQITSALIIEGSFRLAPVSL